jgi:O-antigen/teichoic acid export membrane protein
VVKLSINGAVESGLLNMSRKSYFPRLENYLKKLTWLQDNIFRQSISNAGFLLMGNIASAGFDVVTLSLTARALGPTKLGILILIHTYIVIIDNLFAFQTWQAVIKYGTEALEKKGKDDFKRIVKFGICLDGSSAVIGSAVAIFGLYWFSRWQGWDSQNTNMAFVYCFAILFNLSPTATAILRLFDKFRWLAIQKAMMAFAKMVCIGIAFWLNANFWCFLLIWMFIYIFNCLSLFVIALFVLRRQGFKNIAQSRLQGLNIQYPGIWKFVLTNNLSSSIRLGAEHFDIVIVGAFIGPAATGIYKVAKQFGYIPARLGQPIQQAIYPTLAKYWANQKLSEFRRTIVRFGILSGIAGVMIWLFFLLGGKFILDILVGIEYRSAYGLMLLYMIGFVIYLFGIAFLPTILSMEHPERRLLIYILVHVIYFPTLVLLLNKIGVMGAAIAQIVFHAFWFISMALSIVQFLRPYKNKRYSGVTV